MKLDQGQLDLARHTNRRTDASLLICSRTKYQALRAWHNEESRIVGVRGPVRLLFGEQHLTGSRHHVTYPGVLQGLNDEALALPDGFTGLLWHATGTNGKVAGAR